MCWRTCAGGDCERVYEGKDVCNSSAERLFRAHETTPNQCCFVLARDHALTALTVALVNRVGVISGPDIVKLYEAEK